MKRMQTGNAKPESVRGGLQVIGHGAERGGLELDVFDGVSDRSVAHLVAVLKASITSVGSAARGAEAPAVMPML